MSSAITFSSVAALVPELGLLVLLVAVIYFDRTLAEGQHRRVGALTAWGAAIILLATLAVWYFFDEPGVQPVEVWGGMIRHDLVTLVFRVMFLLALLTVALIAMDVPRLQRGEFFALIITATIGFSLMAASADLIMLYLALETASISLYVLAGYATQTPRSAEAGMKYFIYGAFAAAVMLYGMSLLYGLTGETGLNEVALAVAAGGFDTTILLAAVLVVAGFAFKISAVPFHFWTPDVYEGAPTAVTALVSTASKAAGFAVFLRVFLAGALGRPDSGQEWWAMLVAMSIVTMTLGNFLAIYQGNIKRMLAYSSIAQAGYAMVGLVTLTPDGSGAAMFYLLMYVLTNVAAFGVIILVSNVTGTDDMRDLYGLNRRSPFLALAMLLALLSLGGIPPTAGFFGKFFIFKAAIDAGLWWLAFIAILNAFVALYYYLSVVKYVYLYRSELEEVPIPISRAAGLALGLTLFGVIYLGVVAGPAFEWTQRAAAAFFAG
jgi:NADH-quinone oxidoreductase subunit N